MRLVIFVNTIFHLNSLNITVSVSVCYVSGSKVNRKEKSRPSLFVCFVFHLAKYISLGAFGSVVSVSCLESETGLARKSVRISMITGMNSQHKDLIQESLIAENSYALLFPKGNFVH